MSTNSRSAKWIELAVTLLLGAVMAAGVYVFAGAELPWVGFALAATYRAGKAGRRCTPRLAGRSRS